MLEAKRSCVRVPKGGPCQLFEAWVQQLRKRRPLLCVAEGQDTGPVGLEKLIALLGVALSKELRPPCPCNLLKDFHEETLQVSSRAQVVVKNTPLLPPQFWRATVSQKPEKLRQHPSSEGMASMEGGEGYVGVGVALLAVGSE